MNLETAKLFIDNIFNNLYNENYFINIYNTSGLVIEFIGGEPLL